MKRFITVAILVFVSTHVLAYDKNDCNQVLFGDPNDCPNCNLFKLDLHEMDLSGKDYNNANFRGANLRWANLNGSNLSNARLSQADLTGANLFQANIAGAQFTGAIFCETTMPDGQVNNSECVQGVWQCTDGGSINVVRVKGKSTEYKALIDNPGSGSGTIGRTIMDNMVRLSPNLYKVSHFMEIDGKVIWVPTKCTIKDKKMSCFDGLLNYNLSSPNTDRPSGRRTIIYRTCTDIGAPTNREGVGSR
jgi:hypothetical protein